MHGPPDMGLESFRRCRSWHEQCCRSLNRIAERLPRVAITSLEAVRPMLYPMHDVVEPRPTGMSL
jgi:hypothetical protein